MGGRLERSRLDGTEDLTPGSSIVGYSSVPGASVNPIINPTSFSVIRSGDLLFCTDYLGDKVAPTEYGEKRLAILLVLTPPTSPVNPRQSAQLFTLSVFVFVGESP